jgi:hypothetical protein
LVTRIFFYLLDSLGHGSLEVVVLNQDLHYAIKRFPAVSRCNLIPLLASVGGSSGDEFHQIFYALHPGDSCTHNGDVGSISVSLESNSHLLIPPAFERMTLCEITMYIDAGMRSPWLSSVSVSRFAEMRARP